MYEQSEHHQHATATGCRNEREAISWLIARQSEIATGNYAGRKVEKVLMAELIQDIFDQHKIDGKKSIADDERRWELHLQPFFGNLRAVQVTTDLHGTQISEERL